MFYNPWHTISLWQIIQRTVLFSREELMFEACVSIVVDGIF
jgi:hypothetical protein